MNPFASLRPIVSALRSHRGAVTVLALEIALTLAVLCNLVFIIIGTFQRAQTPSGVDEENIAMIQSIGIIGGDNSGTAGSNLATLLAVPGVEAAAFGGVPLWGTARPALYATADATEPLAQAYQFAGSQGLNRTLNVRVLEGRDIRDEELPTFEQAFAADESSSPASAQLPALLTQPLAARLFAGKSALGQTLHSQVWGHPVSLRVVGVIAPLRAQITGRAEDGEAVLTELKVNHEGLGGEYLIRSKPGQLQHVLPLAARAMQQTNPGHVQQQVSSMQELRSNYFRNDLAVAKILIAIILVLLTVTALGVGGLASFWVQQRNKQIGIRRALGASRRDILRYFQLENLLIVSVGIVFGAVLAYVLNQLLMQRFELDRLSSPTVITGILAMWLLGQLAVLGPALRAAAVPPATATRSV